MKSGARLVIGLVAFAVLSALASFVFTVRMGNVGVRGRITQRIAQGPGALLDLSHEIGFDWDEVFVFAPGTSNAELRDRAGVPVTVALIVNLDSREDIVLLAFTHQGRHRGHIVYPRSQGDFAPAARAQPYLQREAVFEVTGDVPPRLRPAFADEGTR